MKRGLVDNEAKKTRGKKKKKERTNASFEVLTDCTNAAVVKK